MQYTIITPLLLFNLETGLPCTKIYRFVEYTALSCFEKLVQSTVVLAVEETRNPTSLLLQKL